jgi:hypothetical protein
MQATFAGAFSTQCLLSEPVAINNVMPIIHFEAVKSPFAFVIFRLQAWKVKGRKK